MMGPRQEAQPALFYEFSLEDHIPQSHQLRPIGPDVRQSMASPAGVLCCCFSSFLV